MSTTSDPGRHPSPARCAIRYHPDGFKADREQVKGRHSAGAGFLGGLIAWGEGEKHWCSAKPESLFRDFSGLVSDLDPQGREAVHVVPTDFGLMAEVGCLFLPGPALDEDAWIRRVVNERGYSLCGVTHTVASERAVASIGQYLTSPTQPWDALVCTSTSVRAVIERLLEGFQEFYASRGARLVSPVQLPVIPLGVDSARYAAGDANAGRRAALRERLGIAADDVAGLFFGRLSFHAKAHPTPMFMAMQRSKARLPNARLHLLLTGQFPNEGTERNFRGAMSRFCPDVVVHHLDGADPDISLASWSAADFFISLSDNIQESFGLTPIEAMASGLPVVASDYDGYRDTVTDGEAGFRVPSLAPSPGDGVDLAARYALDVDHYDRFIGNTSQSTAVDIEAATRAIGDLVASPDLRRRMGEAGRARARDVYDWRVVVLAYRRLWDELAERRRGEPGLGLGAGRPDYPDPFRVFAGHPTGLLADTSEISLAETDVTATLEALRVDDMHVFAERVMVPRAMADRAIEILRSGPRTVAALGDELGLPARRSQGGRNARARLSRTVAWFYKYGLIAVDRDDDC